MIVDNMDSLLAGIATEDDVQIAYTSSNSARSKSGTFKSSAPSFSKGSNRSQAVPVHGEVHITLSYGQLILPLDALVVDVLDAFFHSQRSLATSLTA